MFGDGNPLREELGKALCCYERALFFAGIVPNDTPYNYISIENGSLPHNNDPNKDHDPYAFITSVYADAGEMLFGRLTDVTAKYFRLQDKLNNLASIIQEIVEIADRDYDSVEKSRRLLLKSNKDLISDTRSKGKSSKLQADQLLEAYKLNWVGLNNICRLFMDEITYLCQRVDQFQQLIDSAHQKLESKRAIQFGFFSFWIASLLALAAWRFPVEKEKPAAEKGSRSAAQSLSSELDKKLFDIENKISSHTLEHEKSIQAVLLNTRAELDKVTQQVASSSVEIHALKENDITRKLEDLTSKMDNIQGLANNIGTSIANNTAQLPAEVRAVHDKLFSLRGEIEELKISVERKNIPQVNINMPKQDQPSQKKSMGLLNIDASKGKDN